MNSLHANSKNCSSKPDKRWCMIRFRRTSRMEDTFTRKVSPRPLIINNSSITPTINSTMVASPQPRVVGDQHRTHLNLCLVEPPPATIFTTNRLKSTPTVKPKLWPPNTWKRLNLRWYPHHLLHMPQPILMKNLLSMKNARKRSLLSTSLFRHPLMLL